MGSTTPEEAYRVEGILQGISDTMKEIRQKLTPILLAEPVMNEVKLPSSRSYLREELSKLYESLNILNSRIEL